MASTVATIVSAIKDRLLIGALAQEPTDAMLTTWLRDAFKECVGDLKPIKRTSVSVSGNTASLTADIVYYASDGIRTLYPDVEWGYDGASVYLEPGVTGGGGLTLWYYVAPDFTGATIDTTCIFGTDWLEELATVMAGAQAYQRLAGVAPSQSESLAAAAQRVDWNDRIDRLYKWKKAEIDGWMQRMEMGYQRRAQLGDLPRRQTPYGRFQNDSSISNALTGARSGS